MKRLLVRLGALGLIGVGGFFGIAQAQRYMGKPDEAAQKAEPAPTTPDGEPPAVSDAAPPDRYATSDQPAASRDPFAGSKLLDSIPPLPARPDARPGKAAADRYATSDKAGNPLRGSMSPSGSTKDPVHDPHVMPASHTDAQPAAEKKAGPRRDPFAQEVPAAALTAAAAGDAPRNAAPAGAAAKSDRYGADRYAAAPQPLKTEPLKTGPSDEAAPIGTDPAPLRESSDNPPDAHAHEVTSPRKPAADQRLASAADRYSSGAAPAAAPQPLPSDQSLRSMNERSGETDAMGAMSRPRAEGGASRRSADLSRRDPSAARPGSRQLDGPQAPQVTVQKIAPPEIQVGVEATFQILVRNTGPIPARDVTVRDVIPEGTKLVSTAPQAQADGGDLQWSLGTLQPGEEKSLVVKLIPQSEGEIGSVANVSFQAEASARSVATRPELLVEMTAPRQVMIGETVAVSIRITNNGTGTAAGVVLNQKLPPQLKHEAGGELEFDVGDIKPREARQVDLTLTAAKAGKVIDTITARAQNGVLAKGSAEMEVLSPVLEVSLEGPRRRFLEREATYTLTVANPGTAAAKDVELVSHLPKGLKFVSANNSGQYNQQAHAVYWSLAELPQGETGAVKLVTLPVEAGDQKLIIEGRADRNISQRHEERIEIDGLAAIVFEVADVTDPIEMGGETAYEVRVVNQGTRAADNVHVTALLPAELKVLGAEGPTRGTVDRDRVTFEPLARLAPKADTTYRIRVQGTAAGDHRVRIQLKTEDMSAPVTKEESTRVFADQ